MKILLSLWRWLTSSCDRGGIWHGEFQTHQTSYRAKCVRCGAIYQHGMMIDRGSKGSK